jgi:rubredoxin
MAHTTWMCLICGWIYDKALGAPDHGIAPGTPWADVPMNWTCPECGAGKRFRDGSRLSSLRPSQRFLLTNPCHGSPFSLVLVFTKAPAQVKVQVQAQDSNMLWPDPDF